MIKKMVIKNPSLFLGKLFLAQLAWVLRTVNATRKCCSSGRHCKEYDPNQYFIFVDFNIYNFMRTKNKI